MQNNKIISKKQGWSLDRIIPRSRTAHGIFKLSRFERFNNTVLTKFLMRSGEQQRKTYEASPIVRAYHKITLQEALQLAQSGSKISKKTKKLHVAKVKAKVYHQLQQFCAVLIELERSK
ncbi:hypothetical protein niasHT_001691 [Heterodera trifolii]|uniref:Uncharacterized protein n=1 Tax=Heterodera trifolii TaxID=157864 RepID=A0ABD2M4C1_9BILA